MKVLLKIQVWMVVIINLEMVYEKSLVYIKFLIYYYYDVCEIVWWRCKQFIGREIMSFGKVLVSYLREGYGYRGDCTCRVIVEFLGLRFEEYLYLDIV